MFKKKYVILLLLFLFIILIIGVVFFLFYKTNLNRLKTSGKSFPQPYQALPTPQCGANVFPPPDQSTLRDYAVKRGFIVGSIQNGGTPELLGKEFNFIAGGTYMKDIMPQANTYDFSLLDKKIQLAQQYGMLNQSESLVYRDETTPDWLGFTNAQSGDKAGIRLEKKKSKNSSYTNSCGGWGDTPEKKQELDNILKNFIQTTITHGGDKVYLWKLVNEPIKPDGSLKTDRCWYEVFGEDYIYKSFQYAQDALSQNNLHALLMLNDTMGRDGVNRQKTDGFFNLVNRIKQRGLKLDAVGIEMHLEADKLTPAYQDDFRYYLEKAKQAGVQVMISEMTVCLNGKSLEDQKQIYKNIVSTCLEYPFCTALNLWGISDSAGAEQGKCTVTKPLLFDTNLQRKPAYYGVMEAISENKTRCANVH